MEGIFDEVAPGLRNALGAAEGPDGNAREDLRQGVFGEVAGHRAPLEVGVVHAAARRRSPPVGKEGEQAAKRSAAAMSVDAMPERNVRRRGQRICTWDGRTMAAPAGVVRSSVARASRKQTGNGDYRREL